MFLKAVPAVLLFIYYSMCTWDGYDPTLRYLQAVSLVLAGVIVLWQVSYAKKKKLFDEFARENLKITDSICLKIAYALMVIAALACVCQDIIDGKRRVDVYPDFDPSVLAWDGLIRNARICEKLR